MRRLAAIVLLLVLAAPSFAAEPLLGQWSGIWTKNGDALPVIVSFAKGNTMAVTVGRREVRFETFSGHFDSDALQVAGIPFAQVTFDGTNVHFELIGDETASMFDGTMSGDVLSGTFLEGSQHGTFQLMRFESTAQPIGTREVTFANGNVTLSGTLLLPTGKGQHPAIVFLHGSGAEGRWANRWLAGKFAEAGLVALIYDKRGAGQSTGDWKIANFDDLAGDGVAAIRFLQTQPEVDPKSVGIYGHSQGATIAPLVAERANDIAFVIASAASGLKPIELERYSVGNSIGLDTLPETERADARAFVDEIVEVAYNGKDRSTLDALAIKYHERSWYFDLPGRDDSYWTLSRAIADYRPLDHWRRVRAPVLLMFGARDARVPAQQSAEAIERTLRRAGNRRVTVHTYPNSNHTFVIVDPPPRPGAWPKREPDYAKVLTDWALSLH